MQEPNLQTIPRDFEISLQNINTTLSLRKAFLPKKGNYNKYLYNVQALRHLEFNKLIHRQNIGRGL